MQVNCAAIPDDLIESELFGHEKGSFTGATEQQIGKFEQADRGTIFLDEVGDMSLKTQAKVLRVLQEGEVERLGSAPDHQGGRAGDRRDQQGPRGGDRARATFREDLFFRLNVIPIYVPPLRERPRGHPGAGAALRRSVRRENNFRRKRFTPARHGRAAAAPLARQHPRAAQRRRAADHHDARTTRSTSRTSPRRRAGPTAAGAVRRRRRRPAARAGECDDAGTLREFKERPERAYLVQKLRENGWNISKTAEVIDTPRSNLYKKLEQYQISQEKDG